MSSPTIRDRRRVIFSSYLGTTIEFYDFLLYATASAVVFGPVFFSGLEPWAGVVAAYGTFAAGYVARPLGGIVFGHFGDRVGRKKLLVLSMLIMGLASTAIGLVPSPDLIGAWAAVLLVLLRVIQGIAIGGEWGGAALMALEHADPKTRGFAASFTNAGAPTGSVLGLLVMSAFSALPQEAFLSWGWRVPFLLSFVLLLVGLYVRSRVSESPVFEQAMAKLDEKAALAKDTRRTVPLLQVLRRPGLLVTVILAATSAFALQTLLSTFAISYTVATGVPRSQVMLAFAGAGIISIATTLLMGKLSDRLGRKPLMIAGNILFILVLPAVFGLLSSGNLGLIFLAFTLGIVTQTVLYGPMAAFIAERFGTSSRYTGASMGYQIATLLGAGFTPIVLANLYVGGESTLPVIIYLSVIALVSLVTVAFMPESNRRSLSEDEATSPDHSGTVEPAQR
ncbi:MFS transporter [Arthrobacter crystallopoietes]|uniref:Predicted arabinose efflux permease, MFS family n=2 Tax=Crystallibacter crystallopoietes TaxID=37928 RepID=A0A1H1BW75_9MICC|nr:MFS transporter [Arthrobacter crystallopoietes]AUI50988.1 MFS transporter [Arthrobacter crystallopoietes]SDQ56184.1 Predicted arabinose efflux permease, MFS family [Arthrobacter crystallopoietes]